MKKIVGGFLSLILLLPRVFPQDSPILNKWKSGQVDHDFGICKIPFSLFGHKIFLKVRINASRELNFVLDTGAVTAVDRRIAAAIGLEEGPTLPSITKSGKASLARRPASFLVGGLEVKDFVPVIADLPEQVEGDPDLEGFIGADLLRFFCVTLDYDAEEIVLSAAPPNPSAPFYRLPMRRHIPLGFPLIDGWVNGGNKITMMIDTGSPFPIVCPITLIENDKAFSTVPAIRSLGTFMAWPGATTTHNYRAHIERIRIGDIIISGLTLDFAELPGPFSLSLVGYEFLKHFVTTLDFPRNELIWSLKPGGFPKAVESSGMAARKQEGRLIVRGLWPDSPADRCGIRVGDEIIRIEGRSVGTLSRREIDHSLSRDLGTGLELELTGSDGPRKVVLRKLK